MIYLRRFWELRLDTHVIARILGVAFTIMFCAGLLMRTPWLSQTICWAIVLPYGFWLLWLTRGSAGQETGSNALFLMITLGLAGYLAVLLLSTTLSEFEGKKSLVHHLWEAALSLCCVIFPAAAQRHDRAFPRYLGLAITTVAAIAAAMLLGTALARGMLEDGRLEGVPAFNWVLNPNAVGGVYGVCFAVAIGHGLRRDIGPAERAGTFAMALLPLTVVILAQSRGAMLGCLVALLLALAASPRRVAAMLFALLAVAAIATAIAFPDWVHAIVGRGDSSRIGLWRHYLELSRDRLWLGRGLDFDPHFRLGDTEIYTPHNILVAALVRSGLVGLSFLAVAMAGALLAALVAALRGWWLPLVVLASALTLSSVDHEMVPSAFGFYWYLFWLPLGLAAAAARSVPQAIRPRPPLPAVSRSGSGGAPAEQPGDDRIQT